MDEISAVSGLIATEIQFDAHATNITNSQVPGYSAIKVNFTSLIPNSNATSPNIAGVLATTKSTNTIFGTFTPTGVPTNIALSGHGYFVVSSKTSDLKGAVQFSSPDLYTRRGDFTLDAGGNLVNGAGYYLTGYKVDPVTGVVASGEPQTIQIPPKDMAPKKTENIIYPGNLPKIPAYQANGTALYGAKAADETVTATNEPDFLSKSIDGGAITVYDAAGEATTVQLRWAKTQDSTGTTNSKWDLYYLSDSTATGDASKWTSLGPVAEFNDAGVLQSAKTFSKAMTINGKTLQSIQFDISNLTQRGDTNGILQQRSGTEQDGYPAAVFQDMSIDSQGRIFAKYSNGKQIAIAVAAVAQFNSPTDLKLESGGAFSETSKSGTPFFGLNGSTIASGGVESSNVKMSEELASIIKTQAAYTAIARVLSTSQTLHETLIGAFR